MTRSATAFTVLKLAGAAYVVWLGLQAIRHRAHARLALTTAAGPPESAVAALRTGFVVGLTNPKTVVFIAAFLPQFVDRSAGLVGPQLVALGLVFCVLATLSDSTWVILAARARSWFARRPERLDSLGLVGGLMMIGLGGVLAASE